MSLYVLLYSIIYFAIWYYMFSYMILYTLLYGISQSIINTLKTGQKNNPDSSSGLLLMPEFIRDYFRQDVPAKQT